MDLLTVDLQLAGAKLSRETHFTFHFFSCFSELNKLDEPSVIQYLKKIYISNICFYVVVWVCVSVNLCVVLSVCLSVGCIPWELANQLGP